MLNDVERGRYETFWIPNFSAAVEELKKQEADVYLIDYKLGEKTGLDLLKEVKGLDLYRPMILLTGFSDREIDFAVMEEGATDFLGKNNLSAIVLERSIRYSIKGASDLLRLKSAERTQIEKFAAEAANEAKSRFLAHMSHEIRTPLTAMLGFTELARDLSHSTEERTSFLEVIKRSGDHLLRVINDILDLSKVEDGSFEVEAGEFDMRDIIHDVVELINPTAASKGLRLVIKFDHLPTTITSDSKLVRQILLNMIGNAVKFTAAGEVKIEFSSQSADGQCTVSICDTGIGIKSDEQTRLFQPFTQANASLNRKFGGTGLGLDLSRKLARVLGGDLVLARSEPGLGSTFELNLPTRSICKVVDREAVSIALPTDPKSHSDVIMRVLIVEDSADNQLLIKHFLKGTEIEASFASNGRQAVEQVQLTTFDSVLMDIQMPEMDGYEATKLLRAQGHVMPIIALTAHTFKEEREKSVKAGFSGFVSKPISKVDLLLALRMNRS